MKSIWSAGDACICPDAQGLSHGLSRGGGIAGPLLFSDGFDQAVESGRCFIFVSGHIFHSLC